MSPELRSCKERESSPSFNYKLSAKLSKLIELESNNKDNFFFEIMEIFGEIFGQKFESCLDCFETEFRAIHKSRVKSVDTTHHSFLETSKGKMFAEETNKNKLKQEIKNQYHKAKLDLKRFQNVLIDIIEGFVEQVFTPESKEQELFTTTDLESLTLGIIFRKDVCYNTYFDLVKYHVYDEEILINQALTNLKHSKPSDFNVDPNFCLEGEKIPYHNVIDCLAYLDVYKNPYDKFATISEIRREILKAIHSYWNIKSGEDKVIRKFEITADSLMPIYCYCLANTANQKVKRHQIFMEDFLDEDSVRFGEKAYYFMTFIASINYLISVTNASTQNQSSLSQSLN